MLEKLEIEDIREVRLKGLNQFDTKFNHSSATDNNNAYTDMSTSPSKDAKQGFKNKMFRIPLFGDSENTEDKLRSAGTAANTASIPPVAMKVDCNSRGRLDFINGGMNQPSLHSYERFNTNLQQSPNQPPITDFQSLYKLKGLLG